MAVAEAREVVEVPAGVSVRFEGPLVVVKGPKGELRRALASPRVRLEPTEGGIAVGCALARRRDRALVGTFAAHLRNMVRGVQEGWTYRLRVVYSHFPVKVKVQGGELLIENFLGEKAPRRARVLEGVDVKVEGDQVLLSGLDVERVGQTAANIERACRVRARDPRVFQDGVYIVEKPA